MAATRFIDFTDLPVDKNGPHGNAWGLWGLDDQLGTLNYLTDEVVKVAAKEEIRTGVRVSLKFNKSDNDSWSMMGPSKPRFPRRFTEAKLINKAPMKTAHDEEISSQWDGTRHYGYQNEKVYFMGHTAEEFNNSNVNGLQNMAKRGIAGRGVLIDWYRWMEEQGDIDIDTFSAY
ncbi:hypothetical protein COCMIDRAFT_30077, partial [Bipolaris oryzae ATCC 44560]